MSDIPALADFSQEHNPHVRILDYGYTLSHLHQVLPLARENHFGVMAFHSHSQAAIEATCEAAWQQRSPVVLEGVENSEFSLEQFADLVYEEIGRMIKKYGYGVPVVLQLNIQEDMSLIDRAVKAGFSSIGCNFSAKSLEENMQFSSEVVKQMHPLGISVEVAIGLDPDITGVEDAYKLVEAARPDALMVFAGKAPHLHYDRIREIDDAVREFNVQVALRSNKALEHPAVLFHAVTDSL